MEGIDVPVARRVAFGNEVERELISRTDDGSARFALREELIFGDFFGFGVMADENDLHRVIFCSQETHHPEKEAARDVFLELRHRTRHVHHGNDDGVRFVFEFLFPTLEAQVFFFEAANFGLPLFARVAAYVFKHRTALVQIRHHAHAANLGELSRLGLHGLLGFFFEERQLQVFKNHGRDVVNVHLGFIKILPRIVTRFAGALPLAGSVGVGVADDVADLGAAVALAYVLALVVVETKLVFIQRPHRHFHLLASARKNDRFIRDDGAEILADSVLDALLMALLINDAFAL